MNTRTPGQEAAIDAAIAHLDFLLQARRAAGAVGSTDEIRSAVVGAALAIVAEPQGGTQAQIKVTPVDPVVSFMRSVRS